MSLRPEALQTSVASIAALEAIVREQLAMIDTRIRESDRKMGRNVIVIDLTDNFGIPGLDVREQQRFVYSSIISNLQKRGFETKIRLPTKREPTTSVYVAYTVEFNPEEVSAMSAVLSQAQIRAGEEVEKFCDPAGWEERAAQAAMRPPSGRRPSAPPPRGAGAPGGSLAPRTRPQ